VHVIGWRQPPNALRTLKIERIERVELQRESYLIPADFNPAELLKDAWGIWYTEDEPVEVILKFGPRVAQRVGETRWHRSEQVALQPDGSLLWQARIAEQGNAALGARRGEDVEVLAPRSERETKGKSAVIGELVYEIPIIKAKPDLT
jgi:predicted DNA-binding transcriptional regulator YafY